MRILYLSTAIGPQGGGIGRSNFTLTDFFCKQDEVSQLNVLSLIGKTGSSIQRNGDKEVIRRYYGGNKFLFALCALRELRHKYNIVLIDHIDIAKVLALYPVTIGARTVLFLHGIEIWRNLKGLKRKSLKKIDLFLANSDYTKAKAKFYNNEINDITVCHPGIYSQISYRDTSINNSRLPLFKGPLILTVGRMVYSERGKGHEQLIRAFPLVLEKIPEAKMVFVGNGDDVPRLTQLTNKYGIRDKVIFTGYISDTELDRYYQQCSVFAMPSSQDGFGLVYLEAMAHSKVCIAAKNSAAQEIVRHNQTGFLVNPDDRRELSDAISRMVIDKDLCRKMGDQARQLYLDRFTSGAFGQRVWLNLIK